MITIIKNVSLYTPEKRGRKDLLIVGDQVVSYDDDIATAWEALKRTDCHLSVHIVDGSGKIATPGFVDSHVHLLGGGGEGGYHTRTPEITLTDLTTSGVTTVVGCLGTDGVTRDMMSLVAKARALETEGISTFLYTGSYQIPVQSLTESIMKDLIAIDKIIGVGEVAISDHRSSQPTFEEFVKTTSEARVGGMLSGKAGVVNIHLGDGKRKMDYLFRALEETEIPVSQYLPTHVNRNPELFEACIEFAKKGGTIDFTGSEDTDLWEELDGEVRVCKGIKRLLEEGVSVNQFTLSSDAQGSLPMFNKEKEFIGLGVGSAKCLLKEIKECVFNEQIPLEIALRAITANPARILKLSKKGHLEEGFDADLCLLDEQTLSLTDVMAKGKWVVKSGNPVVFGTFEKKSSNT